jgi:sulfatase modifying factor 1
LAHATSAATLVGLLALDRVAVLMVAAPLLAACQEPAKAEAAAPPPAPSASSPVDAVAPACPPEMVRIEGFCIDRWEAHLVREDGKEHSPFDRPRSGRTYQARSAGGVTPQGYLSRIEAAAACAAAGKRLCRAREWYRACAGSTRTVLPYGNQVVAGRCNTNKGHLLHAVFGTVHYTYETHYNSPRLNQEEGFLAKTGEHQGCVSEAGTFDQVGNLHEWVADDVSGRLARDVPLEAGAQMLGDEGSGVFMGGYFSSKGEHGRGCAYLTATHAPDYHDYSIGFRCCSGG